MFSMASLRISAIVFILVTVIYGHANSSQPPISEETIDDIFQGLINSVSKSVYQSGDRIRTLYDNNVGITTQAVGHVTVSGDVDALIHSASGLLQKFFEGVDQSIDQTYSEIDGFFKQFQETVESDVQCPTDRKNVDRVLKAMNDTIGRLEDWVLNYVGQAKYVFQSAVYEGFEKAREAHAESIEGCLENLAEQHLEEALKTTVERTGQILNTAGATIVKEISRATEVLRKWSKLLNCE